MPIAFPSPTSQALQPTLKPYGKTNSAAAAILGSQKRMDMMLPQMRHPRLAAAQSHHPRLALRASPRRCRAATARPNSMQGRYVETSQTKHLEKVYTASFAPDGTRVVELLQTAFALRVRHLADGYAIPITLQGNPARVFSGKFSPNGMQFIGICEDATLCVWHVEKPAIPLILRGHQAAIVDAAFSPDGNQVVSISNDRIHYLWDLRTSTQPVCTLSDDEEIGFLTFSADSTQVLGAQPNGTVYVWDLQPRVYLRLVLREGDCFPKSPPPLNQVFKASFSPDGKQVLSCSHVNGQLHVWQLNAPDKKVWLEQDRRFDRVTSASFSPDGKRVVGLSEPGHIFVWHLDAPETPLVLQGHTGGLRAAHFTPDGTRLLSVGEDNSVRLWDLSTRRLPTPPPVVLSWQDHTLLNACFAADATRVICAFDNGSLRSYDFLASTPAAQT